VAQIEILQPGKILELRQLDFADRRICFFEAVVKDLGLEVGM